VNWRQKNIKSTDATSCQLRNLANRCDSRQQRINVIGCR